VEGIRRDDRAFQWPLGLFDRSKVVSSIVWLQFFCEKDKWMFTPLDRGTCHGVRGDVLDRGGQMEARDGPAAHCVMSDV
jgi:hypothetical protein